MLCHSARMLRILSVLCLLAPMSAAQSRPQVPTYAVDAHWPKPLPNRWILGAVAGVAVDSNDHVWIVHRPSTLQPNETRSIWRAAPPVLEFDPERQLLRHGEARARAMSGLISSTASSSIKMRCGWAVAARRTRRC